jgi:hypothetical protein
MIGLGTEILGSLAVSPGIEIFSTTIQLSCNLEVRLNTPELEKLNPVAEKGDDDEA